MSDLRAADLTVLIIQAGHGKNIYLHKGTVLQSSMNITARTRHDLPSQAMGIPVCLVCHIQQLQGAC